MGKLNRREFGVLLSKGAMGTALLAGMPLACGMSVKKQTDKKLGIALVGLGGYSTYQLAPALASTLR